MKAVILAAGTASRLGALTHDIPKCLLRVGPCTIIEHQLAALENRGVAPVIVVTGHGAAHLRRLLGDRVRYVHNERYDETNSMYSMWLAREEAADGFLLLNSDVLFHPALLDRLLDSPYPDALLVDFREDLSDPELMRVRVAGDRLMEISKEIAPGQAQGENVGVVKFGPEGARRLFAKADELVCAGVQHRWAPYVYNAIALDHVLRTIATDGLPWIEIDFAEDLARAGRDVLPYLGTPAVAAASQSNEGRTALGVPLRPEGAYYDSPGQRPGKGCPPPHKP